MKLVIIAATFAAMLAQSGCPDEHSADHAMAQQQEQLSSEANRQVGMPSILNFQEKRMMKNIIELRDKAITTYTYGIAMNGTLIFRCNSVGYGLPYATQYTSPQKIGYTSEHVGALALPQADPNGLFSPATADGTWVLCADPNPDKAKNKGVQPVYFEEKVNVSPFELSTATH